MKQNSKNQETGSHHSHTLGQKQPKELGHTRQVSVEKRTRRMKGEEKREEGEVFTLRVLIHYRKAEARSVTLSQ